MAQEYELWLDESGTFVQEQNNANTRHGSFHPSLIGGWLIKNGVCRHGDLSQFVDTSSGDGEYHAASMDVETAKRFTFMSIAHLKEQFGARIVLFQNKEVNDDPDLYLRLMASGLLQLLQELNANEESLKLHVIIARRIESGHEITEQEYLVMLERYIKFKKQKGQIIFHEDTEMSISIDSARKDNRLKMADYICNTELTLNSRKFNEDERQEYRAALQDAFVYSFEENITTNLIKMALTQGKITDALGEAVFNTNERTLSEMLQIIGNKIFRMGYRVGKIQLDHCAKMFTTYGYMEDDFERSEEVFKTLTDLVIPAMKESQLPCERFAFQMELMLTDIYIREGDIKKAYEELEKCRFEEAALPVSLENLIFYYQLIEKEALLHIDSFDYEKAAQLMDEVCEAFQSLLRFLPRLEPLKSKDSNIISEYYGDALCMKIYANLFRQRFAPDLYSSMCDDSDIALKQYGPHEGELERHRQYRSVIEMQQGNFETAAKWLLMTQPGRIDMESLSDGFRLTKSDYDKFLKCLIEREKKSARRYYLMYYVKIMAEAALAGDPVSKLMANALAENPDVQEPIELQDKRYRTERGTSVSERVVRDITNVIRPVRNKDYHPLEVNYWKQATYCFVNKRFKEAKKLYRKALSVCYAYSDYVQLAVIGLGIWAEYIVCIMESGNKNHSQSEYEKLKKQARTLLETVDVLEIKSFLEKVDAMLKDAGEEGKLNKEKLWEVSRMIVF